MFEGRYGKILTIILIAIIIAIVLVLTIVGINIYKDYSEKKDREKTFAELQQNNVNEDSSTEDGNEEENLTIGTVENGITNSITTNPSVSSRPKTKYYKEYPMVGYIKIEKTKIEYPILLDISPSALDTSVGVMYPTNPNLNQPGNNRFNRKNINIYYI